MLSRLEVANLAASLPVRASASRFFLATSFRFLCSAEHAVEDPALLGLKLLVLTPVSQATCSEEALARMAVTTLSQFFGPVCPCSPSIFGRESSRQDMPPSGLSGLIEEQFCIFSATPLGFFFRTWSPRDFGREDDHASEGATELSDESFPVGPVSLLPRQVHRYMSRATVQLVFSPVRQFRLVSTVKPSFLSFLATVAEPPLKSFACSGSPCWYLCATPAIALESYGCPSWTR